jgi:hypothetical protein
MREIQKQLREKFNRFIDRYGWKGLVALIFYPVITLVTTPVRLAQTLWNCRVLANGKDWSNYSHFNPIMAINNLYYWTQALNLSRYGRSGKSHYLGSGDDDLSGLFHLSLLSSYTYYKAGAVTILVSMFGWWISHAIWIDGHYSSLGWIILVMVLALVSTIFYCNTFGAQNYNVVGWCFFPLGLYGIITGKWALATLAWFAASLGSMTVVFISVIFTSVLSISIWSLAPIFTITPACIKILTHFWPFTVKIKELKASLLIMAKAIGLIKKNKKYDRQMGKLNFGKCYKLAIYIQFGLSQYVVTDSVSLLFAVAVGIYLINTMFIRFADVWTTDMIVLSVATVEMMQNQEPVLLISYWICISPLPVFVFPQYKSGMWSVVPKLKPFSVGTLIKEMENFLKPVSKGKRIFMAFDDPQGNYWNIFDGYRNLLELPLYVASKEEIHFIPNWYFISMFNNEGDPDYWGREVDDVLRNMNELKADYVVVYQTENSVLEKKWSEAGFNIVGHFSWNTFDQDFKKLPPYKGPTPDWWLLEM